jgi:pyruvate dehydrogenase E2 component (dihydrolipoamide acetyltransferase)
VSDAIQMIVMPKWGLAMQEGMVAQWHVAEGAKITKGQEIVDIETSKIANVFESPISGTLRRLVVKDGETVPVAYLIGVVAEESVTDAEIDAFVEDFKANFVFDAAGAGGPEPEDATTAAGRIRYLEMGDGEGAPIVFIHGYGGDLNNWMFNQEELSAGHKTYAVDLPGHGGSTKDVGDTGLRGLAAAVVAFMDTKDIAKAHLVGHSMGGATALLLALEQPDRVASATLVAPAALGDEINMDYINGFIEEKRAKKLRPVLEMLVGDPSLISKDMVEDVLKFKRLDGVDAALKKLRDALMPGGKQAGSLRDGLAGLKVPVQILWGEVDQVLPVGHSEGLPASIKVTRFAGVGHMPHMEKAAETNELIRALAG